MPPENPQPNPEPQVPPPEPGHFWPEQYEIVLFEPKATKKTNVRDLRLQGLGNAEIADRLDMTYGAVGTCASQLIHEGIISAQKRGRKEKDPFPLSEVETQVAQLRNDHVVDREIAVRLGLSPGRVQYLVRKLTGLGVIENRAPKP